MRCIQRCPIWRCFIRMETSLRLLGALRPHLQVIFNKVSIVVNLKSTLRRRQSRSFNVKVFVLNFKNFHLPFGVLLFSGVSLLTSEFVPKQGTPHPNDINCEQSSSVPRAQLRETTQTLAFPRELENFSVSTIFSWRQTFFAREALNICSTESSDFPRDTVAMKEDFFCLPFT